VTPVHKLKDPQMDFKTTMIQLGLILTMASVAVVCQLLLFKTPSNTWLDALSSHQWLYFFYVYGTIFVYKRFKKPRKITDTTTGDKK
jgi:hypothetical protein